MTTAEGVFRLIDRASRPLKEMERQAYRTDVAFEKLGMTMDAVGGRQTVRNFEQTDRVLRQMARSEQIVTQHTDRMGTSFRRVNRDADGFWVRIRRIGATLISLTKILGLFKFPAIIAAVGILVQAIGALAGGIIALLPRIADLAGVLAPLPALFTGIGLSIITVKFAFKDFGEALGGNVQALARLTPEARRLVDTLKLYKPVMDDLRASAQRGLFGGVDFAIRRLQRGVPVLDRLIGRYSGMLGGLARQGATRFTTPNFLRDFEQVGDQGANIIDRMGRGVFNLVDAFVSFAVAARPFTRWLTETVLGWTEWAKHSAEAGKQSGRLSAFLSRTQRSMTGFGHILRDVWFTLRNIGRAARPLGDDLWDSSEKAVAGWRRFTGATGNRLRLIQDFNAMGAGIHEMVGLVGDLGGAIWRMGTSPGFAPVVRDLRELVPVLEHVLEVVASAFGPPIVAALVAFGRTIENLSGATGPLIVFLRIVTTTLNAINGLIDRFPILGSVISSALTVFAISIFIRKVQELAGSWWGVASGATAAARAQAAATGMGVAGGLGAAAGAGAVAGRWVRGPGGGQVWETGAAAATGVAASRAGGLGGRLGGLGRAAGRMAWPVAAIMGAIGAVGAQREGNLGMQGLQTGSAALSGASFGLIPRLRTGAEKLSERERRSFEGWTEGKESRWGNLKDGPWRRIGQEFGVVGLDKTKHPGMQQGLEGAFQRFGGDEGPKGIGDVRGRLAALRAVAAQTRKFTSSEGKAYHDQIMAQVAAHRQLNSQMGASIRQNRRLAAAQRAARSVKTGDVALDRMAGQFNVNAQKMGVEGAMGVTTKQVTGLMPLLEPAGRRHIAQAALKWAAEAKRQNPKLANEYVALRKGIETQFEKAGEKVRVVNAKVLTGSKTQWRAIKNTLVQESQLAKVGLATNFDQIQQLAMGSLTAMGYTRSEAQKIVKGVTTTGKAPTTLPQSSADRSMNQTGSLQTPIGPKGDMSKQTSTSGGPANVSRGLWDELALGASAGLSLSSSHRPGAQVRGSGRKSLHSYYPSRAIDMASGSNAGQRDPRMAAYFRAMVGRPGITEAILSPLIWSPTNGLRAASGTALADHWNHVHVGASGGGGAGGVSTLAGLSMVGGVNVRAPRANTRGVPGALQQAGADAYAHGLSQKLNEVGWGGWHARGGRFTARRPTLIGVGERGAEPVAIGKAAGGVTIHAPVSIGHIDYRGEGDIERIVEAELSRALSSVTEQIKQATGEL